MKPLRYTFLAIAGATMLYACSSGKQEKKEEAASVNVEIYTPQVISEEGFRLSGEVIARQTATISTRMMGYVNKIYVKPGDKVTAGQALVAIKSDEIQAKRAQANAMLTEAEAAAANAKRDYERFSALRAKNSVSDKELENVSLQYTSMKAKVEMAQQQMNEIDAIMEYTLIRAPFAGVITQKLTDEGSMTNPGMPILGIESNDELQIKASIPEAYVSYVKAGDVAKVNLKSIQATLEGKVSEISPSAHRTGGQYLIKISLNESKGKGIRPGMYANILLPNNQEKANKISAGILVDKSSLVYRSQLTGVYVINDENRAILHWIKPGEVFEDKVEVLSGINQQDRVVKRAEGKLHNGAKVNIIN